MMKGILIAILCTLFSVGAYAEDILANGETTLSGHIGKNTVQAIIVTHTVDIGKNSDHVPEVVNSNCTYSRYPCSLVDKISISVNGHLIWMPRSVFSDLADLNWGSFTSSKQGMVLTFDGGDTVEAYTLVITFNAERVLQRKLSSAAFPDDAWQKTIYVAKPGDPNL